jgi:beta-lactam-binding protein with PASTA domain
MPTPTPTVAPPAPVAHCVVPKLNGRKLKAAKKIVRAADCKVGLVSTKKGVRSATGKVVRQSPKAGEAIAAHSAVSLKLG